MKNSHLYNNVVVKISDLVISHRYCAQSVGSSQNAGSGCLFPQIFLFQFLTLFSCNVIFEYSASFLHLWWKLVKKYGTYGSYERDIFVCFPKLREFQTEIGVFVGNIR